MVKRATRSTRQFSAGKNADTAKGKAAQGGERRSARRAMPTTYADHVSDDFLSASESASEMEEASASESAKSTLSISSGSDDIQHEDKCEECGRGGQVLCCDFCTNVYHLKCADPPLSAVPDHDWMCPQCTSDLRCRECNHCGELTYCALCSTAFHPVCLDVPARVAELWTDPFCSDCLKGQIEMVEKIYTHRRVPKSFETVFEDSGDAGTSARAVPSSRIPIKRWRREKTREYFVKWKNASHRHCSWVSESQLKHVAKKKHAAYVRKGPTTGMEMVDPSESAIESGAAWLRSQWSEVERVVAKRNNPKTKTPELLVKWRDLDYDACAWEPAKAIREEAADKVERFEYQNSYMASGATRPPPPKTRNRGKGRITESFTKYKEQPKFIENGELHNYQLEGLNWLHFSFAEGQNVILADEMGLGKTVQSVSFLSSLYTAGHHGPFLVIGPLSTLRNWQREFELWAPHLNVLTYSGYMAARENIRKYEFSYNMSSEDKELEGEVKAEWESSGHKYRRPPKFHVILTSYELVMQDIKFLGRHRYVSLIVDEGHRLKSNKSKLFQVLSNLRVRHRLLLTGTPLQNNLQELFFLLNFIEPDHFNSLEEFQADFASLDREDQIQKLHEMLSHHILRRMKKDVLRELPAKVDVLVRVELSTKQKDYYRAVLTRNFELLNKAKGKGGRQVSLLNIAMELKKVCNHPYLFEGAEDMSLKGSKQELMTLIESSGKLALLDKMLDSLKQEGHRVLIFSQMTRLLDILQDYCALKGYGYERVDGSVTGKLRQEAIDRYNNNPAHKFVFLLSTRAGGLGINLHTADTVVIYDSDWNPHNDLQALARAHRIGQKNKVMIYRLVTRDSIEEGIIEAAKKKMMIEHLVVEKMGKSDRGSSSFKEGELDTILRFGTAGLFADDQAAAEAATAAGDGGADAAAEGSARAGEGDDSADKDGKEDATKIVVWDDAAVKRLLDRSQADTEDVETGGDDFLRSFKVANFETTTTEEAAAAEATALADAAAVAEADQQQEDDAYWEDLLGDKWEAERVAEMETLGKGKRMRKEVRYYGAEVFSDSSASSSYAGAGSSDSDSSMSREGKRRKMTKGVPLVSGEGRSLKVMGWTGQLRSAFLKTALRYGLGEGGNWADFVSRSEYKSLKKKPVNAVAKYGRMFMKHLLEDITPDSTHFSDGVPIEGVPVRQLLVRIGIMELARMKLRQPGTLTSDTLVIDEGGWTDLGRKMTAWTPQHDKRLLTAVLKHGYGHWLSVAQDDAMGLLDAVLIELAANARAGRDSANPKRLVTGPAPEAPSTSDKDEGDKVNDGDGSNDGAGESKMQVDDTSGSDKVEDAPTRDAPSAMDGEGENPGAEDATGTGSDKDQDGDSKNADEGAATARGEDAGKTSDDGEKTEGATAGGPAPSAPAQSSDAKPGEEDTPAVAVPDRSRFADQSISAFIRRRFLLVVQALNVEIQLAQHRHHTKKLAEATPADGTDEQVKSEAQRGAAGDDAGARSIPPSVQLHNTIKNLNKTAHILQGAHMELASTTGASPGALTLATQLQKGLNSLAHLARQAREALVPLTNPRPVTAPEPSGDAASEQPEASAADEGANKDDSVQPIEEVREASASGYDTAVNDTTAAPITAAADTPATAPESTSNATAEATGEEVTGTDAMDVDPPAVTS